MSIPNRSSGTNVVKGPWPEWLGGRATEQAAPRIVRAAFAARVSTDDQQDPTLSLPRQLANCQKALPEDMVVALHFYDVESGRTDLERRGQSDAYKKFDLPIPRDGGMDDLLAEAKRPDRRFDVVICESVDRIARLTYYGTKIEHELEQAGVLLLAADEGITMTRRRATNVLTRRMKQGIAEWYVLDMLEKSWGGFEIHTKQGWNVGQAPYGYVADTVPHPVPARRAEGKHKTRLIPDPVRAATVQRIYDLRITERLGYRVIAERLNADLALNPPPVPPDPARAVGRWTGSSVREILHNPKYTGHMVWNRRASKKGGRLNPVSEWVLSAEPTHPAIVSPDQYAAAAAVAEHRERSRTGSEPNRNPATKRTYALRSYIICTSCGRRMWGKPLHEKNYYCCRAGKSHGHRPEGHPASIVVAEAPLLAALSDFFNTRLLGPDRVALLAADLDVVDDAAYTEHTTHLAAIEREIADLSLRQERLLRQAEDAEPGDPFTAGLRQRYNDLDLQRRAHENERVRLNATAPQPSANAARSLLEHLPTATLNLTELPQPALRQLCETFKIQIAYDRPTNRAHISAEIEAGTIGRIHALMSGSVGICDVPPAGPVLHAKRSRSAQIGSRR